MVSDSLDSLRKLLKISKGFLLYAFRLAILKSKTKRLLRLCMYIFIQILKLSHQVRERKIFHPLVHKCYASKELDKNGAARAVSQMAVLLICLTELAPITIALARGHTLKSLV